MTVLAMEEQCAAIPFQAARMSMCAALVSRESGRAHWSRWMWAVRSSRSRIPIARRRSTTACAAPGSRVTKEETASRYRFPTSVR